MSTIAPPAPARPPATPVPASRVPQPADIPTLPIYRLSVEQYHQMIAAGILSPEDRIELLNGFLVPKMPKNPPHRLATRNIRVALERLGLPGCFVDEQEPITFAGSEPEPDGQLIRGSPKQFSDHHPVPTDVLTVVEVSDSSLAYDRGEKQRLYAEARIPVYWIVNLVDRQIEVYTQPTGPALEPGYAQMKVFGPNDELPVIIDGLEVGRIAVRDILP